MTPPYGYGDHLQHKLTGGRGFPSIRFYRMLNYFHKEDDP